MTVPPAAGPGERATRRLLARLRDIMAHGGSTPGTLPSAPLIAVVQLISAELVAEVCSIYVMRPGDLLELAATEGLNPAAVHRTRLRVGEGIVGLCAATGTVMNLPDAQTHPAFAYRPETGEEPFASMLAVPVRRAGRRLGVLAVQNRLPRFYADDEVEVLETVAMVVADLLAALGAKDGAEEGLPPPCRGCFRARCWCPASRSAGWCCTAPAAATPGCTPRTPRPSWLGWTPPPSACGARSTR